MAKPRQRSATRRSTQPAARSESRKRPRFVRVDSPQLLEIIDELDAIHGLLRIVPHLHSNVSVLRRIEKETNEIRHGERRCAPLRIADVGSEIESLDTLAMDAVAVDHTIHNSLVVRLTRVIHVLNSLVQ